MVSTRTSLETLLASRKVQIKPFRPQCKNKVTRWLRVLGSECTNVLDETSKGAVSEIAFNRLYCHREHAKLHKAKTVTCLRKHDFASVLFVRTQATFLTRPCLKTLLASGEVRIKLLRS